MLSQVGSLSHTDPDPTKNVINFHPLFMHGLSPLIGQILVLLRERCQRHGTLVHSFSAT